jgi:hypothetical protein
MPNKEITPKNCTCGKTPYVMEVGTYARAFVSGRKTGARFMPTGYRIECECGNHRRILSATHTLAIIRWNEEAV